MPKNKAETLDYFRTLQVITKNELSNYRETYTTDYADCEFEGNGKLICPLKCKNNQEILSTKVALRMMLEEVRPEGEYTVENISYAVKKRNKEQKRRRLLRKEECIFMGREITN